MSLIEDPVAADEPVAGAQEGAQASAIQNWLSRPFTITWEAALVGGLFAIAAFSRLWGLGWRVMSHDESLHVYFSWLLSAGQKYIHSPMMHGPLLFETTAVIDRLFGANDFTSRLAPAMAGVFLVIVIPRLLRPWLGKAGALAASVLLLISPFILYYSRYIRHDILIIAWVMLAVWAMLAYLTQRMERYLWILAAALALMFTTMETTFIYLAIFASFLTVRMLVVSGFSWKAVRASAEFDLVVVLATLGAFFSAPIALLALNPILTRLTGAPFVDITVLSAQGYEWADGINKVRLFGLLGLFSAGSILVGLWWDWRRWTKLLAIFGPIVVLTYTTFFSNMQGLGTGLIGSLGYWLSQQSVSRGGQPWYYFLIILPLYEYLPLIAGFGGAIFYLVRRRWLSEASRMFVPLVLWWVVGIFVAFAVAGEKMPWHSTHLVAPFLLLSGWTVGQLFRTGLGKTDDGQSRLALGRLLAIGGLSVLALLTVRTAYMANYVNYDLSTDYMDYAHGAPGVKWALDDIWAVAQQTGEGENMKVAYDQDVSWPMSWYLRIYKGNTYYGSAPSREALDAPVVIAGPKDWTKVDALIGQNYARYEVIRMWWPVEDYKNLTVERIRYALTNPGMRAALWDILWSRNYGPYSALTQQNLNPPQSWPLQESMRIYIRKDIADKLGDLKLAAYRLPDLPPVTDVYSGQRRSIAPTQVIQTAGLNAPRNVAVGPDGSIYVADTGNSRIVKLDASGNVVAQWGVKTPDGQNPPGQDTLNEPWGIAIDPRGDVFVADTWNHRIIRYDANGKFLLAWGSPGQAFEGLDKFWGPRGIAIGKDGRIYVTDTGNKRVVVFDANGKALSAFSTEGEASLDEPVGIATGADGKIYVADTWNMRVAVFSADGAFESGWKVEGWRSSSLDNKPYLALDSQDRVYLTDPEGYKVIVFTAQGMPVAEFGQYGPEAEGFGMPNGLAVAPDGSLWVADAGNNRVVKYPPLVP